MAPQALAIDVALAVKNGPAGMWHALSSPGRIAPYGPLPWWLWPIAVALVALGAGFARRSVVGRSQGGARRRADGGRPPTGGGQVVDLDSRRRARRARRDR